MVTLLSILFEKFEDIVVLGSNAGVQIPKFEGGFYMPDVTVVKGKPDFKPNSNSIITNPYLVVEILSPATQRFDLESKLPEYKHLESLKQMIFINQKKVGVSSYRRTDKPNQWLNEDFYTLQESVFVEDQAISLSSINQKLSF